MPLENPVQGLLQFPDLRTVVEVKENCWALPSLHMETHIGEGGHDMDLQPGHLFQAFPAGVKRTLLSAHNALCIWLGRKKTDPCTWVHCAFGSKIGRGLMWGEPLEQFWQCNVGSGGRNTFSCIPQQSSKSTNNSTLPGYLGITPVLYYSMSPLQ